jgi:hypothetical protein
LKSYKVSTTECLEKRFFTIKCVTGQLGLLCRTVSLLPSVVVVVVVVAVAAAAAVVAAAMAAGVVVVVVELTI